MNLKQHFEKALRRNFIGDDAEIKDISVTLNGPVDSDGIVGPMEENVVVSYAIDGSESKWTYDGSLLELIAVLSNA